jgi:phenylalanyl-tRNA synthetase beta chain
MAMMVNTAWLLEYLEPKCSHEDLVAALPEVGLEIERHLDLHALLGAIRIGQVREKSPLAGAPGMYICQIEIARGRKIPVVCASEHEVQVGWGVPVAPAGTILPGGREIKAGHVHGVASEGMICLDGELGLLARSTGMQHFSDDKMLGLPLTEVAEVREHLLELNVLPNRPDFLGLIGIAREVAALLRLKLKLPPTLVPPKVGTPSITVDVQEPDLCPRYTCGLVRGVRVRPSPAWLKARLLIAGMRPINNVVDVTNYVLYEYGQPLHAFDSSTLRGRKIVVRRMKPGETMELLTGKILGGDATKDAKPASGPLVIADAERPIGLAGIMGGASTQTTERATEILVEAACFDSVNIRHTVKQVDLGMEARGTASSYRFERGTDPDVMIEGALGRALQLIVETAGGSVTGPIVDQYLKRKQPKSFRLTPERVSSYLGVPVDAATIRDSLTRLQMEVSPDLTVRVPSWRVHIDDPVVLIEDVARMIGYGKIPVAATPAEPTLGLRSPLDRLRQIIAAHLASTGYFETRNPSLESPERSKWLGTPGPVVSLRNSESYEMSVLRRSLLPGLVQTVDNNIRRGAEWVRFFEVDRVFDPLGQANADTAPECDRWRVAGIAGGQPLRSDWRSSGKATDFYDLKGTIEDLLAELRLNDHMFRPVDSGPFVAGTSAEISAAGKVVGYAGQIDPQVIPIDRLPFALFAFELDLQTLLELYSTSAAYEQLSRQPAVTRDLAIVVPMTVAFADIEATVRETAGPTLESFRLVDVYRGTPVAKDHQSLALRLVFRDSKRSLTAEDAAAHVDRVVAALANRFKAQLRA